MPRRIKQALRPDAVLSAEEIMYYRPGHPVGLGTLKGKRVGPRDRRLWHELRFVEELALAGRPYNAVITVLAPGLTGGVRDWLHYAVELQPGR